MPEPPELFSAATEKRPFPWKRFWLIILAAAVVTAVVAAILIAQKTGPKYREGRTLHTGVLREGGPVSQPAVLEDYQRRRDGVRKPPGEAGRWLREPCPVNQETVWSKWLKSRRRCMMPKTS